MITWWTAAEISRRIAAREVSCREVASAFLEEIEHRNGSLNAFLTVCEDDALADAERAQAMVDAGKGGPLTGVPVAIKDNLSTSGVRTTCASRILENYVPPFDATCVSRLRSSGAVILGKTNLDEFAMGASTETGAFGPARNPWDRERSPGGSSGGSASAVAAGLAPLALGSDTGGSIRQPASLCGVVGFKPTYGRVSRYGLVAFASSLDQIGPFGRTVEDAALLASVISGRDERDATSLDAPPIDASAVSQGDIKGKRLAAPKELWGEGLQPKVRETCRASLAKLEKAGAIVEEVSLSAIAYGVTTYYIIAPAEASSNLARFDGVRYGLRVAAGGQIEMMESSRAEGFGHEVKARIMIGTYALSAGYYDAYYLRAQQVRTRMRQEFMDAFGKYDFVVTPTSPVTAFKVGELTEDPLALKLLDTCTIPANMGGFPAISIHCGLANGLPVGFQFVGAPMGDEEVLRAAWAAEQILGAAPRPPGP